MNWILYGFKNCGKSTLGKLLAEKIHKKFIDVDQLIEQLYTNEYKETLLFYDIYRKHGKAFFRALEKKAIASLAAREDVVIAVGGGSVCDEENYFVLRSLGKMLYLDVSKKILLKRFLANPPVFANKKNLTAAFEEIYGERKKVYERIADIKISIDSDKVDENYQKLIDEIGLTDG